MGAARKVYLTVATLAAVALAVLWLQPRIEERFSPRLVAAYVAIESGPGSPAVVGPVELRAGEPFRIHAVLGAEGRGGVPLYYTEAAALRIGGDDVPADRLRRFGGSQPLRILWFTIEPWAPFLELEREEDLEKLRFQELFHPDWPMQWAIEGRLDSRYDEQLVARAEERRTFGTQRYQVWIELYADERALVPQRRFKSWGAADLEARVEAFPTASALLPGPAGQASSLFGGTGIVAPPALTEALADELARLAKQRLAFTDLLVLRGVLDAAGLGMDSLGWRRIELEQGPRWSDEIATGDLLRVGARWVLAYRDADDDGALGPEDLCLDFERGAAIRPLGEVFVGEGEIEWARLAT